MATSNQLLDAISGSVVDFLNKSKQAELTSITAAQKAETITAEAEATLRQVAVDQSTIVRQQQMAELEAQNQRRAAALAAGVNPATGANALIDLISTISTKSQETATLLQKYNQEQTTRLIDDPVTWIKAQVDWDNTGEKLGAKAKELELADKTLGVLNGALQQTARTTEALKESVTSATVEASARIAAADATLKSQQMAIEGLKFNTAQVTAAAAGSKDRLDAMYNVLSAQKQQEQLELALKSFALQGEKFSWEREERALAREAKAVGKKIDDLTLGYINQSLGSMGQPLLTPEEFQAQKQVGQSKIIAFHYENGRRIATTGQSMIGNSPAESIEVLEQIPSNLSTKRAEVAALLGQVKAKLDQSTSPMLSNDKANQGNRARFLNTTVNDEIKRMYSAILPGSNNLFDVGDLKSFIGYSPDNPGIGELNKLPIVSKLLSPAIQAGQPLSDPKIVLGLTLEGVKKGVVTSSEAISGLTDIYRRANEINQAARGFTGFGIVPPNAGKNYNVQVGAWGAVVDMTDPTALGRYMSKELAGMAFKEYRTQGFGMRQPIKDFVSNIPLSGGSQITNTPEKYQEGQRRLSDYLKGQ